MSFLNLRKLAFPRLVTMVLTGVLASHSAIAVSADNATEQDQQAALALLEQLISIKTAKGYGQLPAMVDVLVEKLKAAGFTDEDIVRIPLVVDEETVEGLVVRYKGSNDDAKPIAFLAHMDVVDAIPANWETEPYTATIEDGYIYGRGTQDNKFGVALLVSTFAHLKQQGFVPSRDLVLAFSGDEETGMFTTKEIVKHPFVVSAEYALNSDAGGGSMDKTGKALGFSMQAAEKTYATFQVSAKNKGGHSSVPQPDNAIYNLAHGLVEIQAYEFPVEFNPITRMMAANVAKQEGGELGVAFLQLLDNPRDAKALAVVKQYPQYANMIWTTCVATMLEAGHAENALPQDAAATVNCRILPGITIEQVQQTLQQQVADFGLNVSLQRAGVESPASPIREDIISVLKNSIAVNYPGFTLQPTMSSGGTEGREYRSVGIPTYGAGSLALVRPDDSRAHGVNERIPLVSFYKELDYWRAVIEQLAGS